MTEENQKPTDQRGDSSVESTDLFGCALRPVTLNIPMPRVKPPRQEVPKWIADEIKATWHAARDAGGQMEAFRIFEKMTDRLGYGRIEDNPPILPNAEAVRRSDRNRNDGTSHGK